MTLYKLEDVHPNYTDEVFDGNNIQDINVYTENNERVGTVSNVLVDEEGRFRYLVVDTGFWIFGKKVLLPIGQFRSNPEAQRIYLKGLTKQQAENLPEYRDDMTVDFDYEEQVRRVYRETPDTIATDNAAPPNSAPSAIASTPATAQTVPLTPIDTLEHDLEHRDRGVIAGSHSNGTTSATDQNNYREDRYSYDQEPSLYAMNDQEHQTFRLYEEKLVSNKQRRRSGEVAVGKRVETETAQVSVPLEKERVVIERASSEEPLESLSANSFETEELARIELYEETVEIEKQPVVREEIRIRKEVSRETVTFEDTVRREELDIQTEGNPRSDRI